MAAHDGSGRARRAHVAAMAVAAGTQLPVGLAGALGVQLQAEFGRSDAASGVAVSAFFASGALLSIGLGRLVDRIGWPASVRIAGGTAIVAMLGTALLARSWFAMGAFLALAGMGFLLAMPASNVAMIRETAPHRLGLAIGAKQAALPVSSAFAGAAVPAIALTIGWRWAFVVATIPAFVALVSPPRKLVGVGGERRTGPSPRPPLSLGLIRLGIAATIASMIPGVMLAFLVVTSADAGLSEAAAGLVFMIGSVLTLVVRVAAGWVMDRHDGDGLTATAVLAALGGVGALLLATRAPSLVALGGLIGLPCAWGWGGLLFLGVVKRNPAAPGAATGVVQTGASIGTTLGPLLFGVTAEAAGHSPAWIAAAVLSLVAAWLTYGAARAMRPAAVGSPSG